MPGTSTKAKRKQDLDMHSTFVIVLASISMAIVALGILTQLVGSGLKYQVDPSIDGGADSAEFLATLEALTSARLNTHTAVQPLTNGDIYYPAALDAIRGAKKSVDLEAYIFQKGRVTDEFVQALTERARAGAKVNVVLDAVGSFSTPKKYFDKLIDAGGKVAWYHPLRLHNFFMYNNRTHRELLIVDGKVAFLGGMGIADHWRYSKDAQHPQWRDTMFRVEGDAVSQLQGTFSENWLESTGTLLTGEAFFPLSATAQATGQENTGAMRALVVRGTPDTGGATHARILFQALIASAQTSIHITTPYFLPDKSMREELIRAKRDRGVEVTIITPGTRSDHMLTRTSSRKLYGDVLKSGARIFEYQPAMIHAKILIVDGRWSVVGSTNFDHRSFGLNDEVNLAVLDKPLASQLEAQFEKDVGQSREMDYEQWKKRPLLDRVLEWFGWAISKQQ